MITFTEKKYVEKTLYLLHVAHGYVPASFPCVFTRGRGDRGSGRWPQTHIYGSVSVGTYGLLAVPFLGPYIGPTAVSVFTSHGVYFPAARVYTGISLELMNLDYGLAYTLHTKYYFKSKKIAKPFIGIEAGGFSEFSALRDNRPATPYSEPKVYFYAAPSVGIANCFKKVTFEISVRTLIIPGITVERGSWHSGIGVVLGLAF